MRDTSVKSISHPKIYFFFSSRGRGDGNETYDQKLVYIECLQYFCAKYILPYTRKQDKQRKKK